MLDTRHDIFKDTQFRKTPDTSTIFSCCERDAAEMRGNIPSESSMSGLEALASGDVEEVAMFKILNQFTETSDKKGISGDSVL